MRWFMPRPVRRIVAVVVLTASSGAPSLAEPAPAPDASSPSMDGVRPHVGFVPGRNGGPFWTRVVAAETGLPVVGATFFRHHEGAFEGALDHAAVLGVATTDDHGLAVIRRDEDGGDEKPGDAHWVVRVSGYATAIEYGSQPPASIVLRRGETVTIRVLDPFGCPTAGARVDWIDGCSHSPALAQGVTDDEGLVRLLDVDATRGQIWVESPAGGLEMPADLDGLVGFGERTPTILLQSGPTPRGIVVDLAGRPVRGVVLRSQTSGRGPVALSRADGHFRLGVIPSADTLWVRPFDLWPDHVPLLDDVDLSVPLRIVVTPRGIVRRTWKGARARVVVRYPDAAPTESLFLHVRSDDGSVESVECAPVVDRPRELEGVLEVAPGHGYRVIVPEEFAYEAVAEPFMLAPGAEATIPVRFLPRATLRIVGNVPHDATLSLVPGNPMRRLDGVDTPIALPTDARALLRVEDQLGPVRLFEVGAVDEHGVRTVDVAFPAPHLIRWPAGLHVRDVSLRREKRRLRIDADGERLRTYATGACELVLTLDGEEGARRMPIELPGDGPIVLEVDPRAAARSDESDVGSYRVIAPEGASGGFSTSVSTRGGGSWGGADGRTAATIGAEIVVTKEGYVTHRWIVTKAETRDVRWGTCSLDVGVFDKEGAAADARLVLDHEAYAVRDGRLTLSGLEPGPHRLLVIAADEDDGGREIDVVLKPAERRPLRVELGD